MNLGPAEPAEPGKIRVEYVPPPPPPPGKIVVRASLDRRGNPVFATLHLLPEQALELWTALGEVLFDTKENFDA